MHTVRYLFLEHGLFGGTACATRIRRAALAIRLRRIRSGNHLRAPCGPYREAIGTHKSGPYREAIGTHKSGPAEVREMLHYFELDAHYPMLEYYYNGYVFCGRHAHNPWSVICCVRALLEGNKYPYMTYWANTSGNAVDGG